MHRSLKPFAVAVLLTLAGCSSWFSPAEALPIATITIDTPRGPVAFQVEEAADSASQEMGLMYRKEMAPNAGMIFEFKHTQFVSFWMKNTYLPLDLIFVRANGTISTIEPNAEPLSTDSIRSAEPILAVIELNGGRAHQLGITSGARVHGAIFGN
ncbi:MAG TPA: DUF192 domain-containing protein [Rhizomicrobium sp.]|jgi:uncharacterized membrane protein (UPF0127 family)|nr:DUF192 domain-containing protein [Rhizomicrobium sp.]